MILGKKIGLRAVEKLDLPKLKNWRNIESFRRNFREVRELSDYHQENWLETINRSKSDFMFVIEELENNQVIGACGLLYINWVIRSADFSFYIGHNDSYIGEKEGYSIEAARLLIEYGYHNLNLNKIWMELYSFDLKKINFFQEYFKFKIDGHLRQNCFEDGQYHDSLILSLLKDEYKK